MLYLETKAKEKNVSARGTDNVFSFPFSRPFKLESEIPRSREWKLQM